MAIKMLITGDLHLGKRSSFITANDARISTKFTWDNIVQQAITREIDILLLTGDIVDQDNKFYEAIGPLQSGFSKLSQAGIAVYMVAGNHDYDVLSQIISLNNYTNIHLLGANGEWESQVFTKSTKETVRIIGWSFTEKHVYTSALENELPTYKDDITTIAILHGDAYNAVSKYNPIKSETLKQHTKVSAWILGHIHKPDVICDKTPLILYPGSPHALCSDEKDIHGVWLLSLANKKIDYQPIPLSPVCYHKLLINVSAAINETEFRKIVITAFGNHLAEIKETYSPFFMVYDIELTGTNNRLFELRKWSYEIKNYNLDDWCNVSIRSIEYNIQPELDIAQLMNEPSYIGVLANAIITIESGKTNSFIDNLVNDWMKRYDQLASVSVYLPLKARQPENKLNKIAREYLLKECKELITELNLQRNEN